MIVLNLDFYACLDVQGYKCWPKATINRNPLQYVISLNPPLLLTNLCMNPLELIEIDSPYSYDR
jgi:hypothetical protein